MDSKRGGDAEMPHDGSDTVDETMDTDNDEALNASTGDGFDADENESAEANSANGGISVSASIDTATVTGANGIAATPDEVVHKEENVQARAKRFDYLLRQTEIYSHFMAAGESMQDDAGAKKRGRPSKSLPSTGEATGISSASVRKAATETYNQRHRHTEQEEDTELLQQETQKTAEVWFESSPKFITGGEMRDYQVRGLNWLISLHENGINGILADEMGLGKTLQTIALLGYVRSYKNMRPHMVVAPKSTLSNWMNEIARWCPTLKAVKLIGNKEERDLLKMKILPTDKEWDICVTSYEMAMAEAGFLKRVHWRYVIIDEAHRIKNENSKLSEIVRGFKCTNRLLLTGTPLQNNMHELWALLNFLLPDIFTSADDFDAWFDTNKCLGVNTNSVSAGAAAADQQNLISRLHNVLRPFLLRRLKSDVEKRLLPKKETKIYVGMTDLQREWYVKILSKDLALVNGQDGDKMRLANVLMQLRKCCNHPYLFDGAEPGPPYTTDFHLVENCGKLVVLDRLLPKLKEQGSRVLIFSQMTRMLDILQDYCWWRGYQHCRLDGQTAHEEREAQINVFNKPDSEVFIFLLSTRAGGLGINLATADVVVLYDSDWNPQADLQAMDRAHRIGQTKMVRVFRLITENTVEERIIERAEIKLRLDTLVIQQGRLVDKSKTLDKSDMLNMIRHGAQKIFTGDVSKVSDENIDEILRKSEQRTEELRQRLDKYGESALRSFTLDTNTVAEGGMYNFEGENWREKQRQLHIPWIEPPKRERRPIVDANGVDAFGERRRERKVEPPRPKGWFKIEDFQFYPQRLQDLLDKEMYSFWRQTKYEPPLREDVEEELARELQIEEAEKIRCARALTPQEDREKHELLKRGFVGWNKRDFAAYIRALETYGRDNTKRVISSVPGKTEKEVSNYHDVFWDRHTELPNNEELMKRITRGESKLQKEADEKNALKLKMQKYRYPRYQLRLNYFGTENSTRFNEQEDRLILCYIYKIGMNQPGAYTALRQALVADPELGLDWFIKTRNEEDLKRRVNQLLELLAREIVEGKPKEFKAKQARMWDQRIVSNPFERTTRHTIGGVAASTTAGGAASTGLASGTAATGTTSAASGSVGREPSPAHARFIFTGPSANNGAGAGGLQMSDGDDGPTKKGGLKSSGAAGVTPRGRATKKPRRFDS